jgi:hypothetical protein
MLLRDKFKGILLTVSLLLWQVIIRSDYDARVFRLGIGNCDKMFP